MTIGIIEDKYNDLVSNALAELRLKTDISQLVPGAKARALLEIVMRELGTAYNSFGNDLLQVFVKYATGENLDLIGDLLGVTRITNDRNVIPARAQIQKFYVTTGTFGDINNGISFTVPEGTEITTTTSTTQDVISYVLTEDAVCNSALSETFVSVQAVEFGTTSAIGAGALNQHNFTLYADTLADTLKTRNIEGVDIAVDTESDENFRFRISNQTLNGETANFTSVRIAALTVPGVAEVVLDEYARGIGTGAVYIKSTTPTPSSYLIATVQQAIDRVRAFGNFIEAKAPLNVGVSMTITLNLLKAIADQTELKNRVRDTVHSYVNSLDINEALETDTLVRVILGVDSNIKSTGTTAKQIDDLLIYKNNAAEDGNRMSTRALPSGYNAVNFERITIETGNLVDTGTEPIIVIIS